MPPIIRKQVDLLNFGPVVELSIGYDRTARGHAESIHKKLGPDIVLKGMFDTGAKDSVAQLSVLEELGLQPVGKIQVRTANKTE